MTCNEDCLNCPYPDCIKDELPEEKEKRREYIKEWKRKNPEKYEHQKDIMRKWSRNRYHELKAKGICTVCGKQKAVGGLKCPDCTAAYIVYARRYRRKKKAEEMKWMPCSEKMPEKKGRYLCTVCANHAKQRVMTYAPNIFCREGRNTWVAEDGTYCFNWFVEAWMPLPEPWEGEKHGME